VIPVLYEDSQSGDHDFAFHDLLVAMAQHGLQVAHHRLHRKFKAIPARGAGTVIKKLRQDLKTLHQGHGVIAVLDRDKIKDHVSGATTPEAALAQLQTEFGTKVSFHLLDRNLESVVHAIRACAGDPPLERKPKPLERDRILSGAKHNRALWPCIHKRVSSLQPLVDLLVAKFP